MAAPVDADLDARVRARAFAFLDEQRQLHGPDHALPIRLLREGFLFEAQRVPLLGPQGIFKPRILALPLSIATAPVDPRRERPYDDAFDPDESVMHYRYRGTDPAHRDNVGLKQAMLRQVPLVYLFGTVPGLYLPEYPAYVEGADDAALTFQVAFGERVAARPVEGVPRAAEAVRRYATRVTIQRLHQRSFRDRVLLAYRQTCGVCRLRHRELLEASHILPDGHPRGQPIVPNGIALCGLHHAAFDAHILGVRPDLVVELRQDVLDEVDGPMLVHGLQGFSGARLQVPRSPALRPNPEFLQERYAIFQRAG